VTSTNTGERKPSLMLRSKVMVALAALLGVSLVIGFMLRESRPAGLSTSSGQTVNMASYIDWSQAVTITGYINHRARSIDLEPNDDNGPRLQTAMEVDLTPVQVSEHTKHFMVKHGQRIVVEQSQRVRLEITQGGLQDFVIVKSNDGSIVYTTSEHRLFNSLSTLVVEFSPQR